MLGAGEHQKRAPLLLKHFFEQTQLAVLLDFVNMQVDMLGGFRRRTDRDANGILKVRRNQVRNRGFDGRGTKYGLAIGGQGGQDPLDGGKKAHIQHPVRFIQHQRVRRAQFDQLALQKIVEPCRAWR